MELVHRANQMALSLLVLQAAMQSEKKGVLKTDSETDFESHIPFCLGLPNKKTNSDASAKCFNKHCGGGEF